MNQNGYPKPKNWKRFWQKMVGYRSGNHIPLHGAKTVLLDSYGTAVHEGVHMALVCQCEDWFQIKYSL